MVHFESGEYHLGKNSWDYAAPGYTISFVGAGKDSTVFRGNEQNADTFLMVNSCDDTSFAFSDFTVTYYHNGIIMRVSSDGSVATQPGVTGQFENLRFYELGGYYTRNPAPGFAGIQFLGSSNNVVKNCEFERLRDYVGANIHGVYISTFSSDNVVCDSSFKDIYPDPVRLRRGSSHNEIYNCVFDNTGVYAYCSEWESGPSEPELCEGNVFFGNQLKGGYYGAEILEVTVFKPGSAESIEFPESRLCAKDNTVFETVEKMEVPASVKNLILVKDGVDTQQQIPMYSIDRNEGYFNLDDIALIFKASDYGFLYTVDQEGKQIVLKKDPSYTGDAFSVQPDAAEGNVVCNRMPEWTVAYEDKTSSPVFEKDGSVFVNLQNIAVFWDAKVVIEQGQLKVTTIYTDIEVPEEVEVLMFKFPGSFEVLGENTGYYSLLDTSNYDVVTKKTDELKDIIKFENLIRDDFKHVIVGIPVGTGVFGIREWQNPLAKDYYTFVDRKWSSSSGGYADSFHSSEDMFIYYCVIPVGGEKPTNYPRFRVAPNWQSGGIPAYTQFYITDIEKYPTTP